MTLQKWLEEAPFSLAMSSGFFGFFAHAGMFSALEEYALLPRALSGSSAGALVAGLWASGVSAREIGEELARLRREDFWDPAIGLGLLRGDKFLARLEQLLPVARFEDCRVPLAISVFDVFAGKTRVITSGPLAPAMVASCTLPGLFQPRWIEGRLLIDGGVADRPGIFASPPGARLLHHHLASKSPWRYRHSAALAPPVREGLVALVLENLPRVGPFRLPVGARAFSAARAGTRTALERSIESHIVRVSC